MKKYLSILTILSCIGLAHPAAAAIEVGAVNEVQGAVTVTHAGDTSPKPLTLGAAILQNDTIETAKDSRVKVTFKDETEIVMAASGKLVVNEYVFDPAKPNEGSAHFSLLKTGFSYVGGLLDKGEKTDVKLDLDFGSIGIRGTKIYRSMRNGECWIYVEDGKISVSNQGGAVDLIAGQGTTMNATKAAPTAARAWSEDDISWIKSEVELKKP